MMTRLMGAWVAFACLAQAAFAQASPAERDTFRHLFSEAMVEERVAPIAGAYGADTRVMPEYQETGIGPDGAAAYLRAYFDRFDVTAFERTETETLDLGGMVVEIGSFSLDQIHRETGTPHSWGGTYFDVWERTPSGALALVSQSWNYDAPYDGLRALAHFDIPGSTPAQSLPGVAITDRATYEVRALRTLAIKAMMTGQARLMPFIYADDAAYAPHDAPMQRGLPAITEFLANYTANWPPFEFVDMSTDRLDVADGHVVEHMSYNLRWIGGEGSGVSTGKGVRVWKRSDEGYLQSYRQIAMQDF